MTATRSIRALAIRSNEPFAYEVTLEEDSLERIFTFHVQDGDILVVTWSPEFAEYMNGQPGFANQLFAAILAFHRGREFSR